MPTLSIGDFIVDNYGRECVVYETATRPSAEWLAAQEDARVQRAGALWWKALPLEGGAVIVPDELGSVVRRAIVDDLLRLMTSQQSEQAGDTILVGLFQHLRSIPGPNHSSKRTR